MHLRTLNSLLRIRLRLALTLTLRFLLLLGFLIFLIVRFLLLSLLSLLGCFLLRRLLVLLQFLMESFIQVISDFSVVEDLERERYNRRQELGSMVLERILPPAYSPPSSSSVCKGGTLQSQLQQN